MDQMEQLAARLLFQEFLFGCTSEPNKLPPALQSSPSSGCGCGSQMANSQSLDVSIPHFVEDLY